jgi:hypothetical protein
MAKLKLSTVDDDKPVRVTIELPATLHRDLMAYSEAMARESGGAPVDAHRLIAPMLARFIASDRGFSSARRKVKAGA